ncbi:hypothetical protein ACLBOM_00215 [Escherichia coli]
MYSSLWYRGKQRFCAFFRSATPEQELGKLPLGWRRRNVAQPAASSRCAPYRGFLPGRKTA